MQLDVESLRTFLAVLDTGSMTKAAQQLHLGQSAVSRKIQRLEERVGRPLLIRDGHTLRPTRDGRSLLSDAQALVDLHDRSVARMQSSDLSGTVKLSSNGEVDVTQIAALLGTFKYRHPGANVDFTLDHSGSLAEWIDSGTIDIAIFQVAEQSIRPTDIRLWTEDLSWVTSASTLHEDPVPVVDYGTHYYYNKFTQKILKDGGINFRRVFSATSSVDVGAAVAAGIGIAAMSSRYIGGDIVPWDPPVELAPLPRVSQVIRSVPGERPDAVAALIDTIQTELTPVDVTS